MSRSEVQKAPETSWQQYRAALYMRLSKEDENDGPSQSVQNQEALLREFVQRHGISKYRTYADDGWSGTNFERPAFQRMIGDIEAGLINLVITKDLSRLGRDYILTGYYLERYFPEHRIRYISLLDGVDTGIETGANDITPFRAILNDLYAKDISKKIKAVKREKQRRGLFIGGKPAYGYQMHPTEQNRIVVDEVVAPVVRKIFALASTGLSCRKIAARLNEEGVLSPGLYCGRTTASQSPHAGLWSSARISEMLQNEIYLGNMVQGRRIKVSYKSKKCQRQRPEDWVVVEGTHPPLVDPATFALVQRHLESRRHTRSRRYDFLLKGLIFCHECGAALGVMNRKNASGEDVLYFVCRTYQRNTGACTCHAIGEARVTQAVVQQVRRICTAVVSEEELRSLAAEEVRKIHLRKSAADERMELCKRMDRMNTALDQLYLDRANDLLSEDDFQRVLKTIRKERQRLQEMCIELAEQNAEENQEQITPQALVDDFLEQAFSTREVLVQLLERVELTNDKRVILKFRFREEVFFSDVCLH